MAGIEIGFGGIPEPTICGPVSQFEDLTLSSNAIAMGNYGFIAGCIVCLIAFVSYRYVGPALYNYGFSRGWWGTDGLV